jgi:hypothetical protein
VTGLAGCCTSTSARPERDPVCAPYTLRSSSFGNTIAQDLYRFRRERRTFPAEAAAFLADTTDLCQRAVLEQIYVFGQLEYDGLPWRSELWLSDGLRLGPPSQFDNRALLGPRIIIVNAMVDAIDRSDSRSRFAVLLRELRCS